MDIFEKCFADTRAREMQEAGTYPYFKAIESAPGPTVTIGGRKLIMIGSNNYLGLTAHPEVKEAAIKAVEKYGSSCTGSRFLNGTLDLHEELEHRLAEFFHQPAALVFSTGFQTNLGAISTLVGKEDMVLIDRANHASLIDGTRLSFGRVFKYKHNDMEDLERILSNLRQEHQNGILIVSDGVFSMEGDIVDLPGLVALKKKYRARLMIDDAHGIGVLGKNGRGVGEHFALENDIDVLMGTFSKSFASLGGFLAGEVVVMDYIKHNARALIFSASIPPAQAAAVLAALRVIRRDPSLREKLWKNTRKMSQGYQALRLNTGPSQTPIVPIILGDDQKVFACWKALFERGVFVNPIISPAVPPEQALLRTSFMATHTDKELDTVLEILTNLRPLF